jgi:replication-associated recombination protein RarA
MVGFMIEEFIANWKKGDVLLLIGSSGTGKTEAIKKACEKLNYNMWDIDSVDLDVEDLKRKCSLKPFSNVLVVVDVVDNLPFSVQSRLADVVKESNIPIIITAHEQRNVAKALLNVCKVVYFNKPKARDLLNVANEYSKKVGLKPNYDALKGDYRQALLSVYGSGGYESREGIMQIIKNFFTNLEIEEVDERVLINILDNSHKLYGFYTYLLVKALCVADKAKRVEPLKMEEFKHGGSLSVSYFYEKMRLVKEK